MCPKDTWLKLHKPTLLDKFKPTQFELHLMEQGSEVEAWARKLFPGGRLITATDDMLSGQGGTLKRREIADALRAYCKLDTYAMYAIWRVLQDHCSGAGDYL